MANTKITTNVIADDAITSAQIADNAINSEHYVDGSIDTAHYADNSITGAELADNIVIAGTLGSTGKITADAGIDIDNFNIDGTTIALSSGDMTLDVAGDIILDADGGDIYLNDGGTGRGQISMANTDLTIISATSDRDLIFKGVDGSSVITALTLDMSDAGTATFNQHVKLPDNGYIVLGAGEDLKLNSDGANSIINAAQGYLALQTGSTERMRIGSTGKITTRGTTASGYGVLEFGTININNNVSDGTVDFAQGLVFTGNASNEGAWTHAGICTTGSSGYNGNLIFGTDGNSSRTSNTITERMRIDSSGRVGIAQDTPGDFHASADDLVIGNSSGNRGLTIRSGSSDEGAIFFADGVSGNQQYRGSIQYQHSSDAMIFGTDGGTERMRIKSDGQITTQGDILPGADVIMANGRGISFASNAHAGGMTSELLDDYEEGTFTPTFSNSNSTAVGKYTKIGNKVTVRYHVVSTGGLPSSGGQVQIGNLPFTSANDGLHGAGAIYIGPSNVSSATGGGGTIVTIMEGNATVLRLVNVDTGTFGYTLWGELEVSSNNVVTAIGTFTYFV